MHSVMTQGLCVNSIPVGGAWLGEAGEAKEELAVLSTPCKVRD